MDSPSISVYVASSFVRLAITAFRKDLDVITLQIFFDVHVHILFSVGVPDLLCCSNNSKVKNIYCKQEMKN